MRRFVRFGETDAAGVIHFHQLFRWCHEAWEESLQKYGLPASAVFPDPTLDKTNLDVALPVIHCEADFRLPIKTGDQLELLLLPQKLDHGTFQVEVNFKREGQQVALGRIRHLAIDVQTRNRCQLPECIERWIEASSLNLGTRST